MCSFCYEPCKSRRQTLRPPFTSLLMMSSVKCLQYRLVENHPVCFASRFWCLRDCADCSGKIFVVMAPWSNGGHIAAFCPEWIYSAKQCTGFRLLPPYLLYSPVFVLEYRMCNHLYQCVIKWYCSFLEDLGGTLCNGHLL